MALGARVGDRVLVRDRPWRISKITLVSHDRDFVQVEALDRDAPAALSLVVPPEEVAALPNEEVEYELKQLDSFAAWSRAHSILGATLVRETGVVTGARFGRVTPEAYQLEPVLQVLAKPRPDLLIADDVGLGKTIEAGLVLLELMARGRAARVLVVTPPGLMEQWREELVDKFGLEFTIIDNMSGFARAQADLPAGTNPWDTLPRVITSIDFIKKETVKHRALRKRWDFIIVDEAHALAESGTPQHPYRTQRTRLGAELRKMSGGLVLLTATPHNGYTHSFRSLLELVEPTMATLHGPTERVGRRVQAARIRRMKSQIRRRLPDGSDEEVFPGRSVAGIPVGDVSDAEKEPLRKVASYCSRTARDARGTEDAELVGFAMQIVKKRALSSRAALAKTLEHRLEALRKEDAREEPPPRSELRDLQAGLPLTESAAERTERRIIRSAIPREERRRLAEIRALTAVRRLLRQLPSRDPKIEALVAELGHTLAEGPAEKVIVFTEYRDTLEAIRIRLDQVPEFAGHYVTLCGGLTRRQRLTREEAFNSPGVRVLLATDAASEGLNLQRHCRRVVHFELPWNPNRMEQRNGRVDRYGQTREPIIRYLYYPDSPEEDVLAHLVRKIETMIRDRTSTPDILGVVTGGGEVEQGLVDLDPEGADVEGQKARLVRLFDEQAVDFSRNLQPLLAIGPQTPEEQRALVDVLRTADPLLLDDTDLESIVLESLGAGAVQPDAAREGVYRVEVPFACRGEGVRPVYPAATFRRSVAIRHRAADVEYITPLHPLVRSLAAEARRRLLQVYPCAGGLPPRRLAARRVPAGEPPSIVFTFLGVVQGGGGLREESIIPVRVDTDGRVMGDAEGNREIIAGAPSPGEVPPQELEQVFAASFRAMRDRATEEAGRWLAGRVDDLRRRRADQAEILRRDLEVDVADRLREIEEEENRSRSRVEAKGQLAWRFGEEEGRGGFDTRRGAVRSYASERQREIADFEEVCDPCAPQPMGALFLVPAKGGRA